MPMTKKSHADNNNNSVSSLWWIRSPEHPAIAKQREEEMALFVNLEDSPMFRKQVSFSFEFLPSFPCDFFCFELRSRLGFCSFFCYVIDSRRKGLGLLLK